MFDPYLASYQSLDRLIDIENRTVLELFGEVPELLRGIYPLILHPVLSSRFEVVDSAIGSRTVTPFHVVPDMLHRTIRSYPSVELVDETIELTW